MKRVLFLLLLLLFVVSVSAEEEQDWSIWDMIDVEQQVAEEANPVEEPAPEEPVELTAREDLINRIVDLGHELYVKANGKSQRAHYKEDIYVCKNFTVYLFNKNRDDFCIAEYPDVKLRVPNNLPSDKCKPYYYGFYWEDVDAEDGNPFYEAAAFRYDTKLSKEENMALAMEFMRQV